MTDFDPRQFRPGSAHFRNASAPETDDPVGADQAREAAEASLDEATRSEPWWSGYSTPIEVVDPGQSARRILIDACRGHDRGPEGNLLSDEMLLRNARVQTHPDRHQGDRVEWDRVENAARMLGLVA